MDAEPVAIPERLPLDRAESEFFLRYGWPWFPVVDGTGGLVGVVSHEAVSSVPEAARGGRPIASVMARDDGGNGLGPGSRTRSRRCSRTRGWDASGRDGGGRRRRPARDRDDGCGPAGAARCRPL